MRVKLGDVAPLLRRHLPEGDPLLPYADALEHPRLGGQDLRGYLTGSVDVVLRVQVDDEPRYLVVDYKTNWLGAAVPGDPDVPLTSADYRPDVLRAAMGHSDYPLQALLYAVVLHRYLRWRQPGYDPDRTSAACSTSTSVACAGPSTPVIDGEPCGVFSWRPAGGAGRGAVRPPRRRRASDGGASMTELFEITDANDPRLALAATGSLRTFNDAGVLTSADVHVAPAIAAAGGRDR